MVKFQGDLLLGGSALRDLQGVLQTNSDTGAIYWAGQFQIQKQNQPTLEVGRPYLLLLDDGRSSRVVVTQCEEDQSQDALNVHFESTNRPQTL